jgi:hypothetical protein
MRLRAARLVTFLGLMCLLSAQSLWGADGSGPPPPAQTDAPAAATEAQKPTPSREERLATILKSIKAAEAERAQIQKRLKAASTESEKKDAQEDVKRITQRLDELNTSFEELATGGMSVAALEKESEQKPADWKQELEDIVRPLLNEVKRMTERPRTIDRLRSEQTLYQDRVAAADKAIAGIDATLAQTDSAAVKKVLVSLRQDWKSHRADAASRLQLVKGQLERLLAPGQDDGRTLIVALRTFFSGRGLSALLAVGGFAVTYLMLVSVAGLLGRLFLRRREPKTRRLAKVGSILFRVFAFLVALLAAMAILYVRGDWLILALLLLVMFGLVLALRSSLPRYMDELRVLLNLGGVREGERILYKGIPWRIKSLNFYSTLHNPLLRGGTVRVPIAEMADLQSRQFVKEEPWFPSRENDFVILDGDVFGKVLLQTPEMVQLQVIGSVKTFTVADYLAQHPRNLSQDGFAVPLSFGLDYRHQADILTEIVTRMRAYIQEHIDGQVFRPNLKDLLVDFNEAASSSLNLIIVAVFDGAAAEHYWSIRRFLQRTAVDACNRYGWTIPFDQLTLHISEQGGRLPPGGVAAAAA